MTIAQRPTSSVDSRVSEVLSVAAADIVRLSQHRAGRSRVWVAHEVIDAIDTINATIPLGLSRPHLAASLWLRCGGIAGPDWLRCRIVRMAVSQSEHPVAEEKQCRVYVRRPRGPLQSA